MGIKVPEGMFMSTVKVGEKGQIVIPKGARDLFDIKPGDTLLLMADVQRGIAIVEYKGYMEFMNAVANAPESPEDVEGTE